MKVARLLFLMIGIGIIGYFIWENHSADKKNNQHPADIKSNILGKPLNIRLQEKAMGLQYYLKTKKFNSSVCLLIDMNIKSGKKRFFVYNLQNDSVEMSGLVTQGSGSGRSDSVYFSNEPGSNCSSLGTYKIGEPYQGKFGLAYKLFGLDKTNSNAYRRFVVLHAHSCVPEEEVNPSTICESWGCPTVSPAFLQNLRKIIDASEKPILLTIFY